MASGLDLGNPGSERDMILATPGRGRFPCRAGDFAGPPPARARRQRAAVSAVAAAAGPVCTKTSSLPLVSPGTRSVASEKKATKRPCAEIDGSRLPKEAPVAWAPLDDTLTRSVVP